MARTRCAPTYTSQTLQFVLRGYYQKQVGLREKPHIGQLGEDRKSESSLAYREERSGALGGEGVTEMKADVANEGRKPASGGALARCPSRFVG
jgi:hypothetical protein